MTDRDHFAAAALTGLCSMPPMSGPDKPHDFAAMAYAYADAMLRERGRTNHDAAPAARARTDADSDRTDKAAPRPGEGTGDISEAEIDALECVVEDGRIVGMSVYGRLRSLLIRLRPEWEGESDGPKPINDARLAALEQLSALDQELELKHGLTGNPMIKPQTCKAEKTDTTPTRNGTPSQGSVQGEGTGPVAWIAVFDGDDADGEFVWPDKGRAIEWASTRPGVRIAPLYLQPQSAVVRLPPLDPNGAPGWNAAIGAVREALAEAGVDLDTE